MDIREIPIDKILEPETPIRSVADDEKMQELVQSVKETDLLQPLVVRSEGNMYRLVAGHRRFIALRALGRATAPCSVVEVDRRGAAMMTLAENLAREDIDPLDEARYFEYLQKEYGLTQDEIADKIGKSQGYVAQRLALLKLDEDTKHDITYSGLPVHTALELSRVPDKATRDYLRTTAVKGGATARVVHQWVEDALSRPADVDAGDIVGPHPDDLRPSKYEAPRCFICDVSLDERLLQMQWICYSCLDAVKRGMEVGE